MSHSFLSALKRTNKKTPWYGGLLFLSLVYESLVLLRLWLYKTRIFPTKHVTIPTISIGNLTAGGSGKTPMVDFFVRTLTPKNIQCAILSRGYGNQTDSALQRFLMSEAPLGSPTTLGDEPFLLATRNPTTPLYVGKDRAMAARLAALWDKPDILLVDDGYQHVRLHRDLNLLLIDAEHGLGNGYLLPLGKLREPEHHWNRADAILLTKSNLGFSDRLMHQLKKELNVTCPVFKFDYAPTRLKRLDGKLSESIEILQGKKVFLTSGIAHPQSFEQTLNQLGAEVSQVEHFKDHQAYSPQTIQQLIHKNSTSVDFWITTEKDAIKLCQFPELHTSLWVLEMQVVPESAWYEFFNGFLSQFNIN